MTDWSMRYRQRETPWDLGRPHPELAARIAAGELVVPRPGARALVPGCGRGWDARALAEAGWRVTAVDLVAELADEVAGRLRALGGSFRVGDVLDLEEEPFELIFDHTFFCALEPAARPRWGAMARHLVAPAGAVCALVFPLGRLPEQGGPPFGMAVTDLREALGESFRLRVDQPAAHAAPGRAWPERWCCFERILTESPPGGHAGAGRAAGPDR